MRTSASARALRLGMLTAGVEGAHKQLQLAARCIDLLDDKDRRFLMEATEILAGLEQRLWSSDPSCRIRKVTARRSQPRWVVPLEPGPYVDGRPCIEVTVDADLNVSIRTNTGSHLIYPMTSLAACQLGRALLDASRWCGAEFDRREARRKR